MHIAFDARMMGAGNTRGIGRYIHETIQAALVVSHEIRFTLVVRALKDSAFVDHPRVDHVVADIPWYSFSEQFRLARVLEDIQADLIHVPHWNVSLRARKPFVLTVHDLLLLRQPASAKASTKGFLWRMGKQAAFRLAIHQNLKKARRVFVPTQFVAREVETAGHVSPDRIQVTGEGIAQFSAFDSTLCPTAPFLLYVGSAYPHKRVDLLLRAWESVSLKYPDMHLVIAGEKDLFMQKYEALVTRSGVPRVHFVGRVTDSQLAGLYAKAVLFVFPSSHEGFGLPPLEALALGCPVVASDIVCLREILPSQGVEWFREGSEHGMIEALERALHAPERMRDQAEAIKMQVRTQHSWQDSARALIEGYRMTIESL